MCGWKFIIWKEIIPPISDSNKSDLTDCIHKYTQCWQHHKRFCLMRPAVCVCVCICAELQLYHCIKFILKCMCAPWYKQTYLSLLSVKKLRKNAKDQALISAPKWDIPKFPPTQTSTVTSYFSTSNWTAVKATPFTALSRENILCCYVQVHVLCGPNVSDLWAVQQRSL